MPLQRFAALNKCKNVQRKAVNARNSSFLPNAHLIAGLMPSSLTDCGILNIPGAMHGECFENN
jgi:hypothetical protein